MEKDVLIAEHGALLMINALTAEQHFILIIISKKNTPIILLKKKGRYKVARAYDDTIYTHDEAAKILDMFEEILDEHDIRIPSPEDDQREEDNNACLYGSVYSELLDNIENRIICILSKHGKDTKICSYKFSRGY